jgi:hypothetical protein
MMTHIGSVGSVAEPFKPQSPPKNVQAVVKFVISKMLPAISLNAAAQEILIRSFDSAVVFPQK